MEITIKSSNEGKVGWESVSGSERERGKGDWGQKEGGDRWAVAFCFDASPASFYLFGKA